MKFKKNEFISESRFDDVLIVEINDRIHIFNSIAQIIYDNCEKMSIDEICSFIKNLDISEKPSDDIIINDINITIAKMISEHIIQVVN